MSFEDLDDVPLAQSAASTRAVRSPLDAASSAAPAPTTPPPTTRTSSSSVCIASSASRRDEGDRFATLTASQIPAERRHRERRAGGLAKSSCPTVDPQFEDPGHVPLGGEHDGLTALGVVHFDDLLERTAHFDI